ncbi:MAG: DUF687 family protein [Rhabdochlamydiaceae bacterium]|nr:DUF687 family protein [Candidatus Amphrikana amoebophyrae]
MTQIQKLPKEGYFLQICHSQGAIMVRNALMMCPDWIRNKIRVVAIAPAAYIDDHLCKSVVHYVSQGDMVHKFDFEGRERNKHTTIELEKRDGANKWLDHEFSSPTFRESISNEMFIYSEVIKTWKK